MTAITLHLIAILHSSLQKNQQSHKRTTALNTTPSKYHCLATIRLHRSSIEFHLRTRNLWQNRGYVAYPHRLKTSSWQSRYHSYPFRFDSDSFGDFIQAGVLAERAPQCIRAGNSRVNKWVNCLIR